jgi:coenzyme Q-binding protein COQ10
MRISRRCGRRGPSAWGRAHSVPQFADSKLVPYRPDQLFDLVADVGKYPQFLPWCVGARVRSRTETDMIADMTIGFGPFHESFTSRVALDRPRLINVRYENGPFRYLKNRWRFIEDPRGCRVDFFVDFEFRSRILQAAIGVVFNEAVRRMVNAFQKRARDIYGPPTATVAVTPSRPMPAKTTQGA